MRPALLLLLAAVAASAQPNATPAIAARTAAFKKIPGYFPLYWDEKAGKMWLEIDKFDTEFLYVDSMPAGMGSNDLGLDRGQLGGSRIVKFMRSGPKVLLIEPNYRFRAIDGSPEERRSVEESFAQSVLWGFTVAAEEGGRVLVDATEFYLRDAHHIPQSIQRAQPIGGGPAAGGRGGAGGGALYRLDPSRSAFYLANTKGFPKNTEVETILTFTGDNPNAFVRDVTPSPDAVTIREHHSFVELTGPGYKPRAFDPRAGYIGLTYADFIAPLGDRYIKRLIIRHRLQKKDPNAAVSDPVAPIVYYLDRGAPEPIRSALLEGANWWNQAFEAAGYRNAFRVEPMPPGMDPMDVRYNVIQWVHRYSRGWSYGAAVTDPRTGEIIKGQVTLGSLRGRQDYLIFESLLAPYEEGKPVPPEMERVVLARLRQLAAHEVGHTLGLVHNYAASIDNRASVMDYPPPTVKLSPSGAIDLSDAYAVGIGAWDKVAIAYGYSDFPPGADEPKLLDAILRRATRDGLLFISDADSRPEGSAHPQAHLWDSGSNAVDELNRMMDVRAKALAQFSAKNIRVGDPMSTLEDVLAPVYLLHRYQAEAASKVVGGLYYTYALRGDGEKITERVPGAEQRRALDALLRTIRPDALTLPERILALIPPQAHGYQRTREDFHDRTGLTFDPVGAAESASAMTIGLLLNAERAARLVEHHAEDPSQPSLDEVIDRLVGSTFKAAPAAGLSGQVQRATDAVVLYYLMQLSGDESAAAQVRATAGAKLSQLRDWAAAQPAADPSLKAFFQYSAAQVKRFETDPKQIGLPRPPAPPPGMPIGDDQPDYVVW
ncbi:MAG: zinc-dependent metalloprotease [Bryobacteraceae bacterium]